jgi:hypothetical protein
MPDRPTLEIPEMKVWVVSRDHCAFHVFDNVEVAERYCERQNDADRKEHNGGIWHVYRTEEFDVEHG